MSETEFPEPARARSGATNPEAVWPTSATESDEDLRYQRQALVYPRARREATELLVLGGEAASEQARMLVMGGAAMGIPSVRSEFHGPPSAAHWLRGPFSQMCATINPDVGYDFVDPLMLSVDVCSRPSAPNAWVVVIGNDLPYAAATLRALRHDTKTSTIVQACGPGGFVVMRFPDPGTAFAAVTAAQLELPASRIAPGRLEVDIAAAGLTLSEILLGDANGRDDTSPARPIGFYSLHRRQRVNLAAQATLGSLLAEIARPPTPPLPTFAGRHLIFVGAGALSNWAVLPIAMEQPRRVDLHDGDVVERSNLNRQTLMVRGEGRPKTAVICQELGSMDPRAGIYHSFPRFVYAAEDLEGLREADAILSCPDRAAVRTLCGDIGLAHQRIVATAGSSALGSQSVIAHPQHACLRCIMGTGSTRAPQPTTSQACGRVRADSVVSSNMVGAGLLISELRQALGGLPWSNIRFEGDSVAGNRLRRMITNVPCQHRHAESQGTSHDNS